MYRYGCDREPVQVCQVTGIYENGYRCVSVYRYECVRVRMCQVMAVSGFRWASVQVCQGRDSHICDDRLLSVGLLAENQYGCVD